MALDQHKGYKVPPLTCTMHLFFMANPRMYCDHYRFLCISLYLDHSLSPTPPRSLGCLTEMTVMVCLSDRVPLSASPSASFPRSLFLVLSCSHACHVLLCKLVIISQQKKKLLLASDSERVKILHEAAEVITSLGYVCTSCLHHCPIIISIQEGCTKFKFHKMC